MSTHPFTHPRATPSERHLHANTDNAESGREERGDNTTSHSSVISLHLLFIMWNLNDLLIYPVLIVKQVFFLFSSWVTHLTPPSLSLHTFKFIRSWVGVSRWKHAKKKKPKLNKHSLFFFKRSLSSYVFVLWLKMLKHGSIPTVTWIERVFLYLQSLLCLYLDTKLWFRLFPSGEMFQSELTLEAQIRSCDLLSSLIID